MLSKINIYSAILLFIILYAFLVRTINLGYNSPFLDEAIYIVLGKKIIDLRIAEVASSISWVGGFPFFYPLLSAISYSIGGILGSRFLNVILGTASVYLVYQFTRELHLFGDKKTQKIAPIVAGGLMAASSIPIALSRLAIYDALAAFIFILGLTILTRAIFEGEKWLYLISAVILFIAFLAKYIVFIYFAPLLVLTAYLAFQNSKESLKGIIRYFWAPLILLTLVYVVFNFVSLGEFIWGQSLKGTSTSFEVIQIFAKYAYFPFLLSLGGIVFLFLRKLRFLAGALLAGSLVPLIVHLLAHESLSVHQHIIYSLFFVLPLAGLFFESLVGKFGHIGIAVTAAAVFINLFISIPRFAELGNFWPNTDKAATVLRENVKSEHKLLAESGDAIYLPLYNQLPSDNFFGPYVFSYNEQEGQEAYISAIIDGYFDFIEFDKSSFSEEDHLAFASVIENRYTAIFDDGTVKVWRLKS